MSEVTQETTDTEDTDATPDPSEVKNSTEDWNATDVTENDEKTNEAPGPVEGEDAVQVEALNESKDTVVSIGQDVISERKEALREGLVMPATIGGETDVKAEESRRNVIKETKARVRGPHERRGMSFGGPAGVPRKQANANNVKRSDYGSRRGIAKAFPDEPVEDVGRGTNTLDIPARKRRG